MRGSKERFAADDIEKSITKLQSHKVIEVDGIDSEFMKIGWKGMVEIVLLPYNWTRKNAFAPSTWREAGFILF